MDEQGKRLLRAQLIQEINERIAHHGAAPNVGTADAYLLMASIGAVMKDAGARKKLETLRMLRESGESLMDSDDPAQVAQGMLIGAFASTCFDVSKLR
ncbi:hypothetical protein [Acidovorax sp. FG27]|uniref:hypothetical protein n=1 Tax=Acidovorax sp. FG27 TaxID=3133652 RepID=UPI0030E957C1